MDMAHLMMVPIGAGLVLVSDLIGNLISFKSRLYNALTTCIVWAVIFVAINLIYQSLHLDPPYLVPEGLLWRWTAAGVVFAFVADLIGNYLSFSNRIVNSIVTSIVWAVLFFAYLAINR